MNAKSRKSITEKRKTYLKNVEFFKILTILRGEKKLLIKRLML